MGRIRVALLLLALGIAVPTALIVQRALASLELETAVQHEAVAERIFDEMERALSDLIVREEGRPASDYGVAVPAIVFASAAEPFVVGWFKVDAQGETHVVYPRAGTARIERAVELAWGEPVPGARAPEAKQVAADPALQEAPKAPSKVLARSTPAPGRTQVLGKQGRRLAQAKREAETDADEAGNAYEVLQSLNRAQIVRSERQEKLRGRAGADYDSSAFSSQLAAEPRAPTVNAPAPMLAEEAASGASLRALGDAFEQDDVALAQQADAAFADRVEAGVDARADALVVDEAEGRYAARVAPDLAPSEDVRVSRRKRAGEKPAPAARRRIGVDPLIGYGAGEGLLVLARSAWQVSGGERQGIVIDRAGLGSWLEGRVVAPSRLGDQARIAFDVPLGARVRDVENRYVHRFAEPFDELVAQLDLAPLPGGGASLPIYALAGLLFVVGSVGLFAVYRMTRVVVDFAQRRSDFVAAVSHELKTPLTAIRMHGEMLRDGLVSGDAKRDEYYETITDESERLSRLIDNVLEFSRLEQEHRELELVVGSLEDALRGSADKLRAHAERQGFSLRLEVAGDVPAVRYDRDAITQLVFNLVDNALKYARSAETKEIVLAVRRRGDGAELSVRDHGPGVPQRHLRKIFEPFYRGGEELTRTAKGTGIGLALVKELAEAMGAEVRGENAAGGGFEVAIAFAPGR